MSTMHTQAKSKTIIALVAVAAVALLVFLLVAAVSLLTRDTRQDINLEDLTHSGESFAAFQGLKDTTSALCGEKTSCTQAYASAHVQLVKFSTKDAARTFAEANPVSYRSNWIVIHYTDNTISTSDRQAVESYIDSIASST